MSSDAILDSLRQSILDGAPDSARDAARQALEAGLDPAAALDRACVPGMHSVGEKFACHELFLPDMMASSEAMKAALSVLEPELLRRGTRRQSLGRVVLGTVQGDIHEIGKSLVAIMLTANGFDVVDLGTSVPSGLFAARARELQADLVGVSALLTTTMARQREIVAAFDAAGLRPRVKVIVGGAPVTRKWSEEIGADGYGKDAASAVALARDLLGR